MAEIQIRSALSDDAEPIWGIIQEVISSGDTYAFAPDTSKSDMLTWWFAPGAHPFVAEIDNVIGGIYVIRNNQPGLGSHIANGAFMTAFSYRGKGLGKAMGLHALKYARQCGYLAMQFNFVVKSNARAVALWESLGFRIMAEIPGAYRHSHAGLTNVYIMHRSLEDL